VNLIRLRHVSKQLDGAVMLREAFLRLAEGGQSVLFSRETRRP
jgi:hypothetical protein